MRSLILLAMIAFASCAQADIHDRLPTADHVEINRYIGKWYAVTSLPQFFTRKCLGQTAEYGIKDSKTMTVLNTCLKKKGKTTTIEGQAVIKNFDTNAELEVTFNNFFTRLFKVKGEYVIVKIDTDYKTVMVASSNRKSLWIMSRTPSIDADVLKDYVAYAEELGFDSHQFINSQF